jgi:hypothetical protein
MKVNFPCDSPQCKDWDMSKHQMSFVSWPDLTNFTLTCSSPINEDITNG